MVSFSNPSSSNSTSYDASDTQLQMYVSKGSHLHGVMRIHGMARIDGYVEGEIHADNVVHVSKDAVIVAKITAESVVAQGPIRGDIIVREKVELLAPATLEGSIQAPIFSLEEGVRVTGNLNMGTGYS